MELLSDDEYEPNNKGLVVNKRFADKYEKEQRFKDLQRSKELLNESDEESDSEVEDDDAELLSPELEADILKTINSIRKKDPKIYDKNTVFFDDQGSDDQELDGTEARSSKKTYKDVVREQILNEDAGEDVDVGSRVSGEAMNRHKLAYDKEQESIRKAFLSAAKSSSKSEKANEDEDDDNEDDDILLPVKKSEEELSRDREMIAKELKELRATSVEDTKAADDFLIDYISNSKWKDKITYSNRGSSFDNEDAEMEDEEDEEDLDLADKFESKYNFRFEELQDGTENGLSNIQVQGHSRSLSGSLRREDDKRKIQRELRKERKEKEKRKKEEELRRLKNLKKQELQERLKKIALLGGLSELGIDESALEEDWDPEKHEAYMAQQFGDDYYQHDEGDNFAGYSEDIDGALLQDGKYDEDEDDEAQFDDTGSAAAAREENAMEEDAVEVDDLPWEQLSRKERKRRKREAMMMTMKMNEESEDSSMAKSNMKGKDVEGYLDRMAPHSKAAKSMLDELYALDYEDIVAGIPCRFKYQPVEAQGFGLSAEDILDADDQDLNKIVGLKHLATYSKKAWGNDSAMLAKLAKRRKKLRVALKEKRLMTEAESNKDGSVTKKKKTNESSKNGQEDHNDNLKSCDSQQDNEKAHEMDQENGKKKRKRSHSKKDKEEKSPIDTKNGSISSSTTTTTKPTTTAAASASVSSSSTTATATATATATQVEAGESKSRKRNRQHGQPNKKKSEAQKRMDLYA